MTEKARTTKYAKGAKREAKLLIMATNLQIDDSLIQKAVKLGGHKTKKAAVTKALVEYIDHLEQEKILKMFGTVEYDPAYDYKEQRWRS
jgi:Arc/MetJ family transcription regulator